MSQELPEPIFIGFFPKVTQPRPEWLKVDSVREICSVSDCISPGPDKWIERWQHNALGFYNSEQTALALVANDPARYDMYAYELFPLCALERAVQAVAVGPQIGKMPGAYEFLGHDIVTRSMSDFFECSPLSCNHAASDFATNAHCLLDDEANAYQALLDLSEAGSGVEPGPYYLFKVYRKKRA